MNPRKEVVLLFHFKDPEELKKIKLTLLRYKIKIKTVEYKDYNKTIGQILGLPIEETEIVSEDYQGEDMQQPLMIMQGLSGYRLDQFLSGLRKAGVPQINYKAMVTEHNVHWSAIHLYEEIVKEHAMIKQQMEGNTSSKES